MPLDLCGAMRQDAKALQGPWLSVHGNLDGAQHMLQALGTFSSDDLDEMEGYHGCSELYGSTRMLLACLAPDELSQVKHAA